MNSTSTGLRSSADASEQARPSALDITVEEYAALEALLLAEEQNLAQPTDAVSVPAIAPVAKATKFPAEPRPAPPRATTPGKPNERESRSLWQRFQASAPAFAGLAIAVWMGLGLLRLLWRELTLAMALRSCRPVTDGPACQLFDAVQRQAGFGRIRFRRRPRLLASSDMTEPMACGVWSPCIVLPSGCDQRLSRDELRALLAHELAHLLRGDAVWLWAGRVLCSSLSFQPLNFVARRAWQAAAEIQCDDWAVEHSVSVVSLASCLTQVAEWKLDRRAAEALTATSTGGPLTQRIERLLGDRPVDLWKSRWRSRFSLLAGFVLGIGFAWVAPKVDHTLRAQTEAVSDLAERQQLWDEISSDLSAAQADLERLAGKPEATGDDPMRSKVEVLRERARRLR